MTRIRNWLLAILLAPALLFDARLRRLLAEMRAFCRRLPATLSVPLPKALVEVTPQTSDPPAGPNPGAGQLPTSTIRRLADLAALLDRRSPLGVCLRRSLTRYHYLRRAGVPVVVQFGARFVSGRPDREITGHAWLTLDGRPYFEDGENYQGFTVMLSYPQDARSAYGMWSNRPDITDEWVADGRSQWASRWRDE